MIQKLKAKLLVLGAFLFLAMPFAVPAVASAAASCAPGSTSSGSDCITGGLCNGAQNLAVTPGTTTCTEQGGTGLVGVVKTVVNILSIIVGIVAVIMIIVGGFRYITSGGSAESIQAAKNTILYALIGLVIVALSQVIVRFVLTKVSGGT